MRALLPFLLLTACAEAKPPAAPSGRVSVPSWAEGSAAPRPVKTLVASAPISLGADTPEPSSSRAKRIDLDLVSADLPNVCRLIGEIAGVNIVVADGVTGTVTLKLRRVPWDEALDAILLSRGYVRERVGSVIIVRK